MQHDSKSEFFNFFTTLYVNTNERKYHKLLSNLRRMCAAVANDGEFHTKIILNESNFDLYLDKPVKHRVENHPRALLVEIFSELNDCAHFMRATYNVNARAILHDSAVHGEPSYCELIVDWHSNSSKQ